MAREYKSFLIRFQRNNSSAPWRVTLQNAHTGERLRFANERDMLRYLLQTLAGSPSAQDQAAEIPGP